MRVTTQMLNDSAMKAGLPLRDKTLFNYLDQGTGKNELADILASKNSGNSTVTGVNKENYQKMEKAADELLQKAAAFLEKEDSIFEKAEESGDNKEVVEGVMELVTAYNKMLETLEKQSGGLNRFYLESLKDVAKENEAAFKEIGISCTEDGQLEIDEDKLRAADLETLEQLFGTAGTFSVKTGFAAGRISDNAAANLESVGSQYTAGGNAYYAANTNRFDLKG